MAVRLFDHQKIMKITSLRSVVFSSFVLLLWGSFSACSLVIPLKENLQQGLSQNKVKHDDQVEHQLTNLRVMWNKNFDPVYDSGNLPISFNAPLIYEELLFVGTPSGTFTAYHLQDGRPIWSVEEPGPIVSRAGIFTDKEYILYGSEKGRLYAREYLTGRLVYQVDIGDAPESAPLFYQGRVFFHLRNHQIICLDASTGKILWSYKRNISSLTSIHGTSSLSFKDEKVFTGFADGYVVALNFQDGSVLWEKKINQGAKFLDVDVTPVVFNNVVLTASNHDVLTLLQTGNGDVLLRMPMNSVRSPQWDDDQKVYFIGSDEGMVYKLNEQNEVLLEKKISSHPLTSFSSWNEFIVTSDIKGKVYFLSKKNLKVLQQFNLGSRYSTVYGDFATNHKDYIAFYSSRNRLYVLRK